MLHPERAAERDAVHQHLCDRSHDWQEPATVKRLILTMGCSLEQARDIQQMLVAECAALAAQIKEGFHVGSTS